MIFNNTPANDLNNIQDSKISILEEENTQNKKLLNALILKITSLEGKLDFNIAKHSRTIGGEYLPKLIQEIQSDVNLQQDTEIYMPTATETNVAGQYITKKISWKSIQDAIASAITSTFFNAQGNNPIGVNLILNLFKNTTDVQWNTVENNKFILLTTNGGGGSSSVTPADLNQVLIFGKYVQGSIQGQNFSISLDITSLFEDILFQAYSYTDARISDYIQYIDGQINQLGVAFQQALQEERQYVDGQIYQLGVAFEQELQQERQYVDNRIEGVLNIVSEEIQQGVNSANSFTDIQFNIVNDKIKSAIIFYPQFNGGDYFNPANYGDPTPSPVIIDWKDYRCGQITLCMMGKNTSNRNINIINLSEMPDDLTLTLSLIVFEDPSNATPINTLYTVNAWKGAIGTGFLVEWDWTAPGFSEWKSYLTSHLKITNQYGFVVSDTMFIGVLSEKINKIQPKQLVKQTLDLQNLGTIFEFTLNLTITNSDCLLFINIINFVDKERLLSDTTPIIINILINTAGLSAYGGNVLSIRSNYAFLTTQNENPLGEQLYPTASCPRLILKDSTRNIVLNTFYAEETPIPIKFQGYNSYKSSLFLNVDFVY